MCFGMGFFGFTLSGASSAFRICKLIPFANFSAIISLNQFHILFPFLLELLQPEFYMSYKSLRLCSYFSSLFLLLFRIGHFYSSVVKFT